MIDNPVTMRRLKIAQTVPVQRLHLKASIFKNTLYILKCKCLITIQIKSRTTLGLCNGIYTVHRKSTS